MKPNDAETEVPQWLLERFALGELPPEQLAEVRARLDARPEGRQRLAEMEAENRALLERHRPDDVAAEVRRRAHLARVTASHAQRTARVSRWGLALGVVAAAVLVVVALPPEVQPRDSTGLDLAEGTRSKSGGPRLLVHRKEAGAGATLLVDGAVVRAGDVLQLSYQADGWPFGAILSLDGRGAVTLHLPERGPSAARLEDRGTISLPFAYALDDAPAFERFFLVTSREPFDLAAVQRAVGKASEASTSLSELPPGLAVHTLLLRKPSP